MTNLTENPVYEAGVYQLETDDPVIGGPPGFDMGEPVTGHSNAQAQQLANRTAYLKDRVDDVEAQAQAYTDTLRTDLANSTDPAMGAGMVGLARHPLSVAVANSPRVQRALDSTPVSIWEFIGSIADRPDANDMATWDWSEAVNAAIQFIADEYVRSGLTYGKSVYVPALGIAGGYKLRKPIHVKRSGINIVGEGSLTSVFTADAALAAYPWTILLQHEDPLGNMGGCTMIGMGLNLAGVAVGGINYEDAYDAVIVDDVRVSNVHDDHAGFRMGPRTDGNPGQPVSQTISSRNLFVYRTGGTGTVPPVQLIKVQEACFINAKAWAGGYGGSGQSPTYAFLLDSCRSIHMLGCSAVGAGDHGIHVTASGRNSVGVHILGQLYENCAGTLKTSGSGGFQVQALHHSKPRREAPSSGGYTLDSTITSHLDVAVSAVTVGSNCEQNVLHTQRVQNITFSGGSPGTNVALAHPNSLDAYQGTNQHTRVIRASTPRYQFGVDGATDYAFLEWSASGTTPTGDNGIRLGFNRGSNVPVAAFKDVLASTQTAMLLLVNDGAVTSTRQVTVGVIDSGGVGFRVLRVPN